MARPRQISDAEILKVARRIFLDKGVGVSTTAIAEALGISQAALFQRFKTKKSLVFAALRPDGKPPFMSLLEIPPQAGKVRAQMIEIGQAISQFFAVAMPGIMALKSSGYRLEDVFDSPDMMPPVRTHRLMTEWLTQACDMGLLACENPSMAATAWLGSLQMRSFLGRLTHTRYSEADFLEYATELTQMLLSGMLPSEES